MNRILRLLICFGFLVLGGFLCVRAFLVQPPPGAPPRRAPRAPLPERAVQLISAPVPSAGPRKVKTRVASKLVFQTVHWGQRWSWASQG